VCKLFKRLRYWCQDETRFGLKTIQRRRLTLKGIKPVGKMQWQYKTFYLYGVVEPKSGESFFFEFCHLDTICFEKFLELFSQAYPEDLHIIQVDNGSFHSSLQLHLPDNIILLFQPSHTPQVNPIERLWEEIKEELSWELFDNLEALRVAVEEILAKLSQKVIASVTGWDFILEALSVSGI
jgi:transposase